MKNKENSRPPAPPTAPLTWYHTDYLVNLPEQPEDEIRRAFEKMLGPVLSAGVVTSPAQMQGLYRQVELGNNGRARAARDPHTTYAWSKQNVVVWRGCWCVKEKKYPKWAPWRSDVRDAVESSGNTAFWTTLQRVLAAQGRRA